MTGGQGVGGSNPLVPTSIYSSFPRFDRESTYLMTPVIIIPVYNVPGTFPQLIKSIRNETSIPIIIIDDGSKPEVQIESDLIDVKIIKNNFNQGKGYSIIKGLNYAHKQRFTHAITLDADSQHDPVLVPKFLSIDANISIVCGKRDFNSSMPFHRRFSNLVTSKIVSYVCNAKVYDSQCGYRRYLIKDVCMETYIEKGFQFETEVIIKLLQNKLTIDHIKIPTIYANESSSMRNFQDTYKFIIMIIRILRKV